jgi:hypothetical protein
MSGFEPDQLIAHLLADLTPWVKGRKGEILVAAEPYHLLELLAEKPTGFRIVLHWDGDTNSQEHADGAAYLANAFSLGLTCARGLTIRPMDRLHTRGADGSPALLQLVALLRHRVRSLAWPAGETERGAVYRGAEPLILPDGTPLMGFRLRFTLSALPTPVHTLRGL